MRLINLPQQKPLRSTFRIFVVAEWMGELSIVVALGIYEKPEARVVQNYKWDSPTQGPKEQPQFSSLRLTALLYPTPIIDVQDFAKKTLATSPTICGAVLMYPR